MYNLTKSRIAMLGLKNSDIIEELYRKYNIKISSSAFSQAIKKLNKFPKEEMVCDCVEKILAEKEKEFDIHNN